MPNNPECEMGIWQGLRWSVTPGREWIGSAAGTVVCGQGAGQADMRQRAGTAAAKICQMEESSPSSAALAGHGGGPMGPVKV